ncbi:MAG: hypothetical protein PHF86_12810 [Candidatus Nanoarchaeia archaeon]|nr:hypothetical protein [Candidatus Nanoarchaeia archaeon]
MTQTLEQRLGIEEKQMSNGGIALVISDPNEEIKGILHKGKKLIEPQKLAKAIDEKYLLQQELDFNNELLGMHRYFDSLRDSIKRKELTVDKAIEGALTHLAGYVGAFYVGFNLNENLKVENKVDVKNINYVCTEVIHGKEGYKPLNGKGKDFFKAFRDVNEELKLNFQEPKNNYYEDIEQSTEQVSKSRPLSGSAFTFYLKPGHDVIGAIQAIQTKKIGPKEGRYIKEWVNLADTFLSDILNIKIEADNSEIFTEEQPLENLEEITDTDDERVRNTFGLSTDEMGAEFIGGGDYKNRGANIEKKLETEKKSWKFYVPNSYFDKNYTQIRDQITHFFSGFTNVEVEGAKDIESKKFEKGKKLINDIYRERPEFNIDQEEAEKDLNSAVSNMKMINALYLKYGDKICKEFKLSDGREIDQETLETASIFTAAFAKAVKYMHQADILPRIEEVRERNDIRELTGYLASLIETPKIAGEFVYFGEPLVNKFKKPSLLGSTVIDISNKLDPNKESHFAIDLIEKVMTYEERIQNNDIDKTIWKMYEDCVKQQNGKLMIDNNGIYAIRMIDTLVHDEKGSVYPKFKEQMDNLIK